MFSIAPLESFTLTLLKRELEKLTVDKTNAWRSVVNVETELQYEKEKLDRINVLIKAVEDAIENEGKK